jgi:hypothetical protein
MRTAALLLLDDGLVWVNFRRTCNGSPWLMSYEEGSGYAFPRTFRAKLSLMIYFFKVQTHCYEAVDLDDLIRVWIFNCRGTGMEPDDGCAIAFQ